MPVGPRSSFETKVLSAFAAAMLVVIGLAIATWKVAHDAAEAVQWVTHTHAVIDSLARIRSDTLQIEFSTQSFRISGDPARLAERDETIQGRESLLNTLQALTSDNTLQRERWSRLRQVIDERLAISRQVEQLRKLQGAAAANAYVATAPLLETRTRTYRLLREMEAQELDLLEQRNADYQDARQHMVLTGVLASLLLLGLLATTYALIRRQLRVTEAHRHAVVESEANLSTTLHSIGDAVLVTDTQGRVTRMNPVAEQLTGWPQAQALGRPITDVFRIIHESTREPAEVPVTRVLTTGEIQGLANHTALIARDGHEHPIADSAAPIRDAAGRIDGVVLVFRDVSAERQAQQMIRQQNELLEQRVQERTTQLRESERHLRSIISAVPVLIAYVDAAQRYVYVNDQYRERFAPNRADLTGYTVREILGEERYAVAAPRIAQVMQGHPQSYDWEPFPDVWQAISYVPRYEGPGQICGYYVLGTDISERKLSEAEIGKLNRELAERFDDLEHVSRALRTLSAGNRTMVRAAAKQDLLDSMCEVIATSGGYRYAAVWYCNDDEQRSMRLKAQSGFLGGSQALAALQPSWGDNARGHSVIGIAVRSGQPAVARDLPSNPAYAPWRTHLHGVVSGLACPLHVGGKVIGALSIYSNSADAFTDKEVSLLTELADDLAFGIATMRARQEQRRTQEALHHLTHHDALTGLPNETQFTEVLTRAVREGQHTGQPFALLQTNIERLSEINDALGFSHGDQLLRDFGTRLSRAVPAGTTVARLRGDEFAVLLPGGEADAAVALVRELEKALAPPFAIADIALDMLVKIGVVLFPAHGSSPHDLFRHMDMAMRQAKRRGLGHAVFDPLLNPNPAQRLTFAGELRRAIEGGDLALYLQPKVEIATGRVCGTEGLVRWRHATRGLIPQGEFIELAEHTGLIRPLTTWVMETAFRLNHAWSRQGCALPIAVNLSARNLRDEKLIEQIRQLQATWNLAPGLLEVEITESTVMEDAEFALRVLQGLRAQGIPLYIDDFGTGYSSLSYLQKLPVDYIKIDQSFVHDMPVSKDSQLIVRSTIDLAHDIGRKVVAEGVETREHWEQLAALGCDIAQGYFIARPMPADAFPDWLRDYRPPGP
ncbi:MAG: EAL domain-containing protein [Burkholderiales bacterium]|nr:EAL domain-containing protein [Burkholderiales bacterium]